VENVSIISSRGYRCEAYLGERERVNAVLGGDLHTNSAAALGVPGGLGTNLDRLIDLVVVAGGEDAQVVGSSNGCVVNTVLVPNGCGVPGHGGLLDIVASLATNNETLMTNDSVNCCGWTLEKVGESTEVERGLLEHKVELGTGGLSVGLEGGESLNLETFCDVVIKLELSIEDVDSGPCKGTGDSWSIICDQRLY
jgi:hypothetical protein